MSYFRTWYVKIKLNYCKLKSEFESEGWERKPWGLHRLRASRLLNPTLCDSASINLYGYVLGSFVN